MAGFKWPESFLGLLPVLLPAIFLASNVTAHPLAGDDDALSAGLGRSALTELLVRPGPEAIENTPRSWAQPAKDALISSMAIDPMRGVELNAPAGLFVAPSPATADRGAGFEKPDPLSQALRAMVNVKRRDNGAAERRVASPNEQITAVIDDGLSAVVLKVEQGLAEVVSEALDARIDDEGRVTFSLAGVGGFHLAVSDSALSFGRGDTVVAFNRGADNKLQQRVAGLDAVRAADEQAALGDFNPLRELLAFIQRAFHYPLFWVLVLLLLVGEIALMITRVKSRRRLHRRSSASEAQKKPKRSRIRVRLKRVRSRIRLQQTT